MARAYQLPDGRVLRVSPGLNGTWIIGIRNQATGSSHRYRGLGVYDTREAAELAMHQKAGAIRATQGPARWWTEVELDKEQLAKEFAEAMRMYVKDMHIVTRSGNRQIAATLTWNKKHAARSIGNTPEDTED